VSEQATPLELSAVVLGYRAGDSLADVAQSLDEQLSAARVAYELVLVANYWPGAEDRTPAVASAFAASRPHVRVLAEPKRGGMGWDMRRGLEASGGEYFVVIDGDAQNPVGDVVRVYRTLKETGADVVKGRRVLRHDGLYRRLVSIAYNVAFRVFFGTRGLWDINGKPKGMTRRAFEALELRSDDWFIDAEIVLKARDRGLEVREVPVEFFRNPERESFVDVGTIGEFVVNMLRRRLGRG
jgi:glycosyltransferase involved in cell wall biosynthesis